MNPKDGMDELDADLKKQDFVMETLQSTIAENKEASEGLEKSLDNLEAVTQKIQEGKS